MQHAYEHVSEPQRIGHVEDYTRVIDQLMDHVLDGDVVLFKASNGVKLHKVVADILAQDG
jgi:UDP-N-acetylmuramyl pentapeptide synthase